ncbi:MAG: response regulator [Desulfobulbaceae bacterium]|uniref:histidine kinase n=1 Tax=Candidatus Desulfatifera sulfidica TaxID=2841691 RepID=A0A8J6N5M5_9BACT|nr:response regulator [Candidatus Desulfatifera sulfidica]
MTVRWKDLSFKLPLIVLLIGLVPLAGFGLFSIRYEADALLKVRGQGVRRSAVLTASAIERTIQGVKQGFQRSAENLDLLALDKTDQEWALMTLLIQWPNFKSLALLDAQGQEQIKVANNQNFLPSDLQSRAHDPAFRETLEGHHYLDAGRRLENGEYVSSLSIPMLNPATQEVEAVLIADFHLKGIMDVATSIKIGQTGQTYVIDKQGLLIAHNDMSLALRGERLQSLAMLNQPVRFISVEGHEVLGSAIAINGTDWLMVAEVPMTEITAVANKLMRILYGILIASALLLVFPMAFYLILRISRPLQRLEKGAVKIGAGKFGEPLPVKNDDEIGRMSHAFNDMAGKLQHFSEETERINWLKAGLSGLDEQLRGTPSLKELASRTSSFLAEYVGAPVGAFYVQNTKGNFVLTGGYAHAAGPESVKTFAPGQGLVGQAALEQKMLVIDAIPEGYLSVSSSLGSQKPVTILVIPLIHDGIVVAVLELGKFKPFSGREKMFIEQAAAPLAVTVNSANARHELNVSLEKSQKLTEKLQVQQEELRIANEELAEQTQELQASEEQLRVQQEELRISNEELEEKSISLTEQKKDLVDKNIELQNTKTHLEQKSIEVERASRYKSEFLANMSHELRTPLNSLLILSQDLANNGKGNLLPEQVEAAEIVYNSGNDLLKLINEILDLAKIESGKLSLAVSDVPISDIIGRLEKSFQHIAKEQRLGLEISCDDAVPETIRTDPARLDQILKNLVSNALKFTEEGQVTISVTPVKNGDGAISIAVTDTGIGIAQESLEGIFNAFQQIDGSISRKFSGTGLGLSISRELTKLLGGELQATSQPGIGSTFTLILPPYRETVETAPASPPETTKQQSPQVTAPAKNTDASSIADERDELQPEDKRILIIEDDLSFAKILAERCQKRGFKFLHAGDGETGLELVERYSPDAIILDMRLPGIQGMEVLDAIKDNPQIRHIPVHIMSAYENTGEAFAHGAIGFLQKPINQEQLGQAFTKLEEMISGKIRNLLIVEDNIDQQKSIQTLIGNGDVNTLIAGTGEEALTIYNEEQIDCIILDLNLPEMTGLQFLERLSTLTQNSLPPVIIYSARELTREEVEELNEYTQSIVIKGAEAPARLLDEASLFLHRVVGNLPQQKQQMINELYDQSNLFQGKKILLVDDDMRNIFAIAKILEEKGAQVLKAANGQKALDLLATTEKVGLVLMDIMMPVMDGLTAMKQIRAQKQFESLPIIALTAKAMEEDRKQCIAAGANDYLSKPVDINRLLSLIRVWILRK